MVLHQLPDGGFQAGTFGRSRNSSNTAWLSWCGSGEACSTNQRWMGVSGASPTTGPCSASAIPASSADAARAETVGWLRNCRTVSRIPSRRARAITWMARIESPPSAKKLSSMPTFGTSRTSDQMRQSVSSARVLPERPTRGADTGSISQRLQRLAIELAIGRSRQLM